MVFRLEKPRAFWEILCCYSSLLRSALLRDIICRYITYFRRNLAAGRSGCVIGRSNVLQQLVHRLQRLIVLIENL